MARGESRTSSAAPPALVLGSAGLIGVVRTACVVRTVFSVRIALVVRISGPVDPDPARQQRGQRGGGQERGGAVPERPWHGGAERRRGRCRRLPYRLGTAEEQHSGHGD